MTKPASMLQGFLTAAAFTVALAGFVPGAAAEPVLIEETSAAIVPLENETTLAVRELRGDLSFRLGKEDAVQFMAVDPEDRDRSLPVALWKDGRALVLRPADGAESEPVRMEVTVPRGFALEIQTDEAVVQVRATQGFLKASGTRLDLRAYSVAGIDLDLVEGAVEVHSASGEVDVDLRDVEGTLGRISGGLTGRILRGTTKIGPVGGALELDVEGGSAEILGVSGRVRLTADSASVGVQDLAAGGELRLAGTDLEIRSCSGDLDVETDRDVAFEANEGDLHVNSWGGSLFGRGNKGLVEIKTSSAAVHLEEIGGPVRIQGDGLDVRLKQVVGELMVLGSSSRIEISGASAPVTVENEFGDVFIAKASDSINVYSREGVVHATDLSGAAEIDAEGEEVQVGWVSLSADKDSRIRNGAGAVVARFPAAGGGGCALEAVSNYGRIETDLPGVRLNGEEDRASGTINRRNRPHVRIEAEDGVRLYGPGGSEAEGPS